MKRLLTLALSLTLLAGCTQSDKELKLNEKNIKKSKVVEESFDVLKKQI